MLINIVMKVFLFKSLKWPFMSLILSVSAAFFKYTFNIWSTLHMHVQCIKHLFSQGQVYLLSLTDYFITKCFTFFIKKKCFHKIHYYVILPLEDARFIGLNECSSLLKLFGIIAIKVTHFKVCTCYSAIIHFIILSCYYFIILSS